jgi:putative tricarboxylic transport membrane protein
VKYGDCWAGAVIAVIGAIAVAAARQLEMWSDFGPGPGFFPVVLGSVLVLMGGWVSIAGWLHHGVSAATSPTFRKPFKIAAAMAAYIAVMQVIGFTVATALFLFILLRWIESRPAWQAVALAVCVTAGVHLVFVTFLKSSSPVGIVQWTS